MGQAIAATAQSNVEKSKWKIFAIERSLLSRKKPISEPMINHLVKGLNNGKRQKLEEIFGANKEEIETAFEHLKETLDRRKWNWFI
jgi:hypothetical protein